MCVILVDLLVYFWYGKRESMRRERACNLTMSDKTGLSGSTAGAAVVPLLPGAVLSKPSSTASGGSTTGTTARGTAGLVLATGMLSVPQR